MQQLNPRQHNGRRRGRREKLWSKTRDKNKSDWISLLESSVKKTTEIYAELASMLLLVNNNCCFGAFALLYCVGKVAAMRI